MTPLRTIITAIDARRRLAILDTVLEPALPRNLWIAGAKVKNPALPSGASWLFHVKTMPATIQ
jgi:hypothetical protein